MIPEDFKDFFVSSDLAVQQQIVSGLLALSTQGPVLGDDRQAHAVSCPHCGDGHVRANGRLKGVQRYVCKGCGKNFSETKRKFWYNVKKKDKVDRYLYCLLSGYSLRISAKETGISLQTFFDWRHRLLTSFATVSPEGFHGITESDELFFAHSEKGNKDQGRPARKRGGRSKKVGISVEKVAVVATCDRTGNKDFKVATRGCISKKDLEKVLGGKLEKASVLCSDAHRSYAAFAKGEKMWHKKSDASK